MNRYTVWAVRDGKAVLVVRVNEWRVAAVMAFAVMQKK